VKQRDLGCLFVVVALCVFSLCCGLCAGPGSEQERPVIESIAPVTDLVPVEPASPPAGLLDLTEMESRPNLDVVLDADGILVGLGHGPNPPYLLGVAETSAEDGGWFGEECMSVLDVCHRLKPGENRLALISDTSKAGSGNTLFSAVHLGCVTFVVHSAAGNCWSFGHHPGHYVSSGCEMVEVSSSHSCRPEDLRGRDRRAAAKAKLRGLQPPAPQTYAPVGCCMICSKGQACGDSCISRNSVCHRAPGCACDG